MIHILSETQNEIRFTNSATIYLEVATVKLAQASGSAAPSSSNQASEVDSQLINQLQAEIKELKKRSMRSKRMGNPSTTAKQTQAPVQKKQASTYRIPTERVYQVLREATRKHLNEVKEVWDDLLMSLSVTQRAMLKASEPVAASPNGLVIAFDYEIVCQRAANDEELQLAIHNNLSRMIKDYAPDSVYITRESWPTIRKDYLVQAKDGVMMILCSEDSDEEIELIPQQAPSEETIVTKAEEIFGTDVVTIIDD